MGRGGYAGQDRAHSSSSHVAENTHANRNSADGENRISIHGGHGPQSVGMHGNERREMHTGGGSSGGINSGEQTSYSGHGTHAMHQGDRGGTQGNISASGGSGGHSHSTKLTAAPEFEMKGNDFPALPGAGESIARKTSESSEGANAWGESNR